MKRRYVRIVVIVLWLCAAAWLVRYEAFPEVFTRSIAGYHSLLSRDVLLTDSWMKILAKGIPVGYSHTNVEFDDSNPLANYKVNNRMSLKMTIMGESQSIHVTTAAVLNMMYDLQRFDFSLTSREYSMKVAAIRSGERRFKVKTVNGTVVENSAIEIPDDVVIYSPMMEMSLKNLKPGQELTIKTLDPLTMSPARILIRAERREPLVADGVTNDATVLSMEYAGAKSYSWLDSEGRILRQETPAGWTMQRCSAAEALKTLESSAGTGDFLAAMAVPCEGVIRDPEGCKGLRLRLKGVPFERSELETGRQTVQKTGETETEMTVMSAVVPSLASTAGAVPDDCKPFIAASQGVQSDHPEFVRRAAEIVGRKEQPLDKARAIFEWVHRKVDKRATVSLPSALDVLHTMRGDCNEHTYLFVALARAAGLPAKIMVGLAHHEGAFYYHAWPAVYVGEWLEMDPTWGQEGVDATHIALVQGGLTDQMRLVKVVGQLKIKILEEYPRD